MTKENDLFDRANDLLSQFGISDFDNDQENFRLYLDLTRRLSWDIPSALGCSHGDRPLEIPMHRPADYANLNDIFISWDDLDNHFKEVHGLDLTDDRINWSFDT